MKAKVTLWLLASVAAGILIGAQIPRAQRNPSSHADRTAAKWHGQRHLDTTGRVQVTCPANAITILVLGQSNAANSVGERFVSTDSVDWVAGKCYRSAGPTLGSSGQAGSVWPLVGDQVRQRTGKPVVFIGLAVSGTSVEEWERQTEKGSYITGELAKLQKEPVSFVVWHQGESDFATAAGDYERRLQTVIGRVRSVFPSARVLVAQASLCAEHPARPEIRAAQAAVVDGLTVLAGPNTDVLSGFEDRYDACHFTGAGARKAAAAWAASIVSAVGA